MPRELNVSAPEFIPRAGAMSSAPVAIPLPADPWELSNVETELELSVSPAELEELEEVESWVQLMSDLEMEEHNHMIEMALRFGDKKQIHDITQRMTAARREKASANKHHARPQAMKKAH